MLHHVLSPLSPPLATLTLSLFHSRLIVIKVIRTRYEHATLLSLILDPNPSFDLLTSWSMHASPMDYICTNFDVDNMSNK